MSTTSPGKPEIPGADAVPRELAAMPADELRALAESLGLDASRHPTPTHLSIAVHARRQLIEQMDREALVDVIRWARRPVAANISKLLMAQEIARLKTMRFEGLSQRGLIVLAQLRGVRVEPDDPPERLIRRLKRQEGIFQKLARKQRRWLGSIVSNMLGEGEADAGSEEYKFLPPEQHGADKADASHAAPDLSRPASLKDEIEDAGLFGGLAGRIKRSADSYMNQKLDEIEARIDKKLDDIDRRLAEWRDKEVANRLRIIKITLWASMIVAGISLIYSFIKVYIVPLWH